MPSWLVTGASRGIGLSIVEELLKDESNFVIATARDLSSSKGLTDIASKYPKSRIALVKLDVTNDASVTVAVKEVTLLLPNGLDYLVNNAGVHLYPMTPFSEIDLDLLTEEVVFNAIAPIRKSEKKNIIIITSVIGSIELGGSMVGLSNAYAMSKASLNMLGRKWGGELKHSGVTIALIHPGWMKTEIGDAIDSWMGKYAPDVLQITPEESADGIIKVSQGAPLLESGTAFYNMDGSELPW